MNKLIKFIIVLLSSFTSFAQSLSPNASISILTVAPGDALYSTFGHSAIRINDPLIGLDVTYNYGAFDFRTEGFYLKFLRGTLPYQISGNYFQLDLEGLSRENRAVIEQVLNLSASQKEEIYAFLQKNYLPENREYAYKFFYDNCSTRLRDVLKRACRDSLVLDQTLHADSSYREWIDKYAIRNHKSWADFGMDLAIGIPADEKTGYKGAMFLPDNLMDALDKAKINKNGQLQPFVIQKSVLNRDTLYIQEQQDTFFKPLIFSILLLIMALLVSFMPNTSLKWTKIFDKVLFSSVGTLGWVIVFLWFLTDHGVTAYNLNIFWAFPLALPAIFLVQRSGRFWLYFFKIYAITQILLLISWKFIPQTIHFALVPLVMALALRAFFIAKK